MEWDVGLPKDEPGLIFSSRAGYRRLWPRPEGWQALTDAELEALCGKARSLL